MRAPAPESSGHNGNPRLRADTIEIVRNAGIARKADSGVPFSVKVVEAGPGGRLLLSAADGGKSFLFIARSSAPLPVGSETLVVAERDQSGPVLLRIVGRSVGAESGKPASLAAVLKSFGIPPDAFAASLAAAAALVGLPLDPARTVRLHRLLSRSYPRSGNGEDAAAFLATAADDKGLSFDSGALRAAADLIDPDGGGGGDRSGAKDRDEGDGRGAENRGAEDGVARDGDKDRLEIEASAIRAACVSFQEKPSAISIMNGTKGSDGSRWLIFPLRISDASVALKASLRLLLVGEGSDSTRAVERFILDVSAPSRTWFFEAAAPFVPGVSLSVSSDPPLGADAEAFLAPLAQALATLGVSAAPGKRRKRNGGDLVSVDEEA